jgi:uroporphyrinogen III methyltransferase / synthase
MHKPPFVYIVGAGPGDPALVTVRGRDRLGRADVVVYDHRVPEELLEAAPAGAERIDVGAAAPKALDQEAISYLLAEKAREGKIVVRLKWGDPFVFDSGGKEALFLHENRIPFEVVPGVPLLIAGPAYAGVPLTYPDGGDAVILIRGHESETDEPNRVDWAHVAAIRGTLVCFAAARQIAAIAKALVAHGREPDDAAVLVYDATTAAQHTIDGTLGDIASRARDGRPALLIVGAVANFRQHLRWFDTRPLFGRRIVVTRPREQAGELVGALEELGAAVVALPAIRIRPADNPAALDAACDAAPSFDWIVFTSVNGVEQFLQRYLSRRDVRELKGPRICAVGPSTSAALTRYGIRADVTPAEYRAEGILPALREHGPVAGKRFLLPRAQIARELLAEELRAAGAYVADVTAYCTVEAAEGSGQDIYRMLLDRGIDAVTFTSASTVRHFVELLGAEQAPDLLAPTIVAAIGPVTADAARQLGLNPAVVPGEYTIPALVAALVEHFAGDPVSLSTS